MNSIRNFGVQPYAKVDTPSIYNGSQPAPLWRALRYPWRVRRQRRALLPEWFRQQAGKSRLSGTNTVSRTVRGRKRTMRTFAHVFDSSYHSVSFRDDNEAYNHYANGNWGGIVRVVRSAVVNSAL